MEETLSQIEFGEVCKISLIHCRKEGPSGRGGGKRRGGGLLREIMWGGKERDLKFRTLLLLLHHIGYNAGFMISGLGQTKARQSGRGRQTRVKLCAKSLFRKFVCTEEKRMNLLQKKSFATILF